MRALTQRMLEQSGIDAEANPAIVALCDFAAQRSGIDPRNYFSDYRDSNGRRAYREEVASIGADLRRFREALNVAATEGVTDADVIAEAPHAFSGRLEWVTTTRNDQDQPCASCAVTRGHRHLETCTGGNHKVTGGWEYCTGQYFPTEYRKATATLLEYATRRVRQTRPKEVAARITTIAQLKALAERNGSCWFERSTMRFFRTRIESGIIQGRYFITSEQREDDTPRRFTVRSFDSEANINTVGEFHGHHDKQDAVDALREHIKSLIRSCATCGYRGPCQTCPKCVKPTEADEKAA